MSRAVMQVFAPSNKQQSTPLGTPMTAATVLMGAGGSATNPLPSPNISAPPSALPSARASSTSLSAFGSASGSGAVTNGSQRGLRAASVSGPTGAAPLTSAMNRPAGADGSLYQVCSTLKTRLERVPGLQRYFEASARDDSFERRGSAACLPAIGAIPPGKQADPVTQMWRFFRLGSSLCALFNALGPNSRLDADIVDDPKACKRGVYHFVQACKAELGYSDEELFTISNVFSDNTSDLLKVIRTVQLIVDALEKRGLLMPARNLSAAQLPTPPEQPKDQRDKVVDELLVTERKYVQDLEVLGKYYNELQSLGILSADTVHQMLPNLLQLIDFQRRFLVGIEYHASLAPEEQRFGLLFCNMEGRFDVYEGYALNQKNATDIAQAEAAKLHVLDHILESKYELHGMLIKPVQRICKYPLLLRELVRNTPASWPYYQETVEGLETMKKITNKVNETQRRVENIAVVKELSERLRDWRGHNIEDFGELLHDGIFTVIKVGVERDYHLYLFENIILCCKEAAPSKKSSMGLKKQKNKRASLVLKGRIYMAYITNVSVTKTQGYLLHISWGKDDANDTGFFDIRFRNEELLSQWESTIRRMVARYEEVSSDIFGGIGGGGELDDGRTSTAYDDATDDETMAGEDGFKNGTVPGANGGYFFDSSTQGSPTNTTTDSLSTVSTRTLSTPSMYQPMYNSTQLSDELSHLKLTGSNVSLTSVTGGIPPVQQQRNRSASTPNYSLHTMAQHIPPLPPISSGAGPKSSSPSPAMRLKSESALATLGSYTRAIRERSAGSQDSTTSVSSRDSRSVAGSTSAMATTPSSGLGSFTNMSTASSLSTAATAKPQPTSRANLKVKLHYLEDTFLLMVPSDIAYQQLLERVERKIRLCGKQTPSPLRLKYKDEDDDFVTINSEEDIQMALEILQSQDQPSSATNDDSSRIANDFLSIWVA